MKTSRVLSAGFVVSLSMALTGSMAVMALTEGCGSDSKTATAAHPDASTVDRGAGGKGGTGGHTGAGGAAANTDAQASCGDGVVSAGESCDTAITSGEPGACPTLATCDDGNPCTAETIDGDGTCDAACAKGGDATADLAKKDRCCPPGETAATDADCSADCGNGKLDAGETCDTAISSGKDACIETCPDDGDPCTNEALVVADPCNPVCKKTTTTTAKDGDSCCPKGATRANDSDCTAVCGNGVVEAGEDCEGTSATCAACTFVPTAFRMTTLTLVDPHTWVDANSNCLDITAALNGLINKNLTTDSSGAADGGANGALDLSFGLLFRPLDQSGKTGNVDFLQPLCVAPDPPASCGPNPAVPAKALTYANKTTGNCLEADPANLTGTYDAPPPATAGTDGCFITDPATLTLPLGGVNLTFESARMAAQYTGDPATGGVQGLFIGFMSEATAKATVLPTSLPLVGGQTLDQLFPPVTDPVCTGIDDRDNGPDGTTRGWWWHLSFEGAVVPWTK